MSILNDSELLNISGGTPGGCSGRTKNYTVKPGETLEIIAMKENVSVTTIMQLNNLSSQAVTPGQVLLLPA